MNVYIYILFHKHTYVYAWVCVCVRACIGREWEDEFTHTRVYSFTCARAYESAACGMNGRENESIGSCSYTS